MFLEILRTLIQVLCVFSILIIAFGMAFYTLMYTDVSTFILDHSQSAMYQPTIVVVVNPMQFAEFNQIESDFFGRGGGLKEN